MDPPAETPFLNGSHERISSYFLGGKAENLETMKNMLIRGLESHADARKNYYPLDPSFITSQIQASDAFKEGINDLEKIFRDLSITLNTFSVPFYSARYAGHMSFETSMAAILGWALTILYNPNNVAFEASPITTIIEIKVGYQLSKMLGYNVSKEDKSKPCGWGHIACDGTVANLESIWQVVTFGASRNLKFYPLSLREAMKPGNPLSFIEDTFRIRTCSPESPLVLFKELSTWQLLNLGSSDILNIPERLQNEYGITATFMEHALQDFLVQTTGKDVLEAKFKIAEPCQYLISSTKHYSWPKGAALAGIGSKNMVDVPVDKDARIDIDKLRDALKERLKRKQAVYAVVAIIGSTEEGAVDPLDEIVKLKKEFEAYGMTFLIHADAAWGGYFASMIRSAPKSRSKTPMSSPDEPSFVPSMTLRKSTIAQLDGLKDTDSITIDPHKAGYIPYPAGGLCYRDGRMRFLVTWTAPYIHQGSENESIGIYGVEGSKPGAPAVATFLHHEVVGLHKEGHGMLLGEASFTCTRLSAHWAAMSDSSTDFIVVPFNHLVDESDEEAIQKEKKFIRDHILGKKNEDVVKDSVAMEELRALGSDLNINAFACNFRIKNEQGGWKDNEDVEEANYLNSRIFQKLSITTPNQDPKNTPLFISSTTFAMKDYGECCTNFKRRMKLETESRQDLFVLRNVCMNPFVTDGDFVKELADTFEGVLKEEMEPVIKRNTVSKQKHKFIVQGNGPFYLVYRPFFHHANGRYQLILSVDLSEPDFRAKQGGLTAVSILETKIQETLDNLVNKSEFPATLSCEGKRPLEVNVTNIRVIKNRSLLSQFRDLQYPSRTPFYLYGTKTQMHIDHMLLRAPNAQLCAEDIKLTLNSPRSEHPVHLTDKQLANGLIAVMETQHEIALQPFGDDNPPNFFKVAKYPVTVYTDSKPANASGPGLANVWSGEIVGTGTLEIVDVSRIWVDYKRINTHIFDDPAKATRRKDASEVAGIHLEAGYTSSRMNVVAKDGWRKWVDELSLANNRQ